MLPIFLDKRGNRQVNSNERELEQAGYDRWKLDNGDVKSVAIGGTNINPNTSNSEYMEKLKTIWSDGRVLGKCPCCKREVRNFSMYVETEVDIYHFFCFNLAVSVGDLCE
jgi:hypothetical protein